MNGRTQSWHRVALALAGIAGIALVVAMLLLVWTSHAGVRISVENQTEPSATLSAVDVSVEGASIRIGDILHGERRVVHLHPKGESGVALDFTLDGRPHATRYVGYVENGDGDTEDFVVRERGTIFACGCISTFGLGSCDSCDPPLARVNEAPLDDGGAISMDGGTAVHPGGRRAIQ